MKTPPKTKAPPTPQTVYAAGEREKATPPAPRAPGVIKVPGLPQIKVTGPGRAALLGQLLLILHFAFCISQAAAAPGILPQPGTEASVFTNRLLTVLNGAGVTNRLYFTNAAIPAFGPTNTIHIRSNSATAKWEWHTDYATVAATNDSNRATGTWHVAGAGAALYGATYYEPRSPQTVAGSPSSASIPIYLTVDADGVIIFPPNFLLANDIGTGGPTNGITGLTATNIVGALSLLRSNAAAMNWTNAGTLWLKNSSFVINRADGTPQMTITLNGGTTINNGLDVVGGGISTDTGFYGLIETGAVTNAAGSRVAYLSDGGGGGTDAWLTTTTNLLGRYGVRNLNLDHLPRTRAKLQSGYPLHVLSLGDDAVNIGTTLRTKFEEFMPFNGHDMGNNGTYLLEQGNVAGVPTSGYNPIYPGYYFISGPSTTLITNVNGSGVTLPTTSVDIYYWASNSWGPWTVFTNNAVCRTLPANVGSAGAATTPMLTNITFALVPNCVVVLSNAGAGILKNIGQYNSNQYGGYVLSQQIGGNIGNDSWFSQNAAISNATRTFLGADKFDLIVMNDQNSASGLLTGSEDWESAIASMGITPDIIYLGQTPTTNAVNSPLALQSRLAGITNAIRWGRPYVDVWGLLYPSDQAELQGLLLGGGDVHMSTKGLNVVGQLLAGWAGLDWAANSAFGYTNRIFATRTGNLNIAGDITTTTAASALNLGAQDVGTSVTMLANNNTLFIGGSFFSGFPIMMWSNNTGKLTVKAHPGWNWTEGTPAMGDDNTPWYLRGTNSNLYGKTTFGTPGGPTLSSGTGSPESVVTAIVGSIFLRLDGSTSTTLYVKTTGSGNTGWTAK